MSQLHLDPDQTLPRWRTRLRLRMGHVGLSLTLVSISRLNFQLVTLKYVSLSYERLCLVASIVFSDTAFSFA